MRTTKKPEERKEEIVQTAKRLFVERGYKRTQIKDIVGAVGVAQGLFYYYFKSKEDVMEAVAAEYGTKIFCRIRELVNQDISAIQKLMAIYDFFIDAAQQQKALFLEIQNAGGGEVHEKIILDVGGKLIPYISQIIKEGKKNGELSCEAPDLVSHFCVSGMIQVLNAVPADQKIQFMTDNRKIFIGLFVRILEIKEC
ncbi:TetR/AcrR family transcriptional regulator [Pseudoramibacter alactolyticus]|jgi:AcrR family transcriptional regulator|uniref:TetR/AcrR family transcriptional regulator n=1 Tax=Pseudoramibacter alactolyticus TaxID=113287 RepID=UPI00235668DC|nr:TetR/AcrR family transcriptional regulator [Pseudoramibacter alactolyticus]MBM6969218.1 TetR/AcrR family transcriptional regulator [Pseudoramibacter alactolyticus]